MARRLVHVLDGDEAAQAAMLVDQGQLLDSIRLEDGFCFLEADAGARGDQAGGHDFAHLAIERFEAQISIGQDADQAMALDDHRQAGNPVALHDLAAPRRFSDRDAR